jgi:L-fuconolactonase
MKIDTHQHYWHYQRADFPWISDAMPALQRDCLPADCASAMRAAGVDAVVAVQARCSGDETDFLLRVAQQHPTVVGVVGWADLRNAQLPAQLEQWRTHAAFKGLRHILQDVPDAAAWVADAQVQRGLRAVQQHGLVYDVLVFDHQLGAAQALCARHDTHWVVLDHVGKPALRNWAHDGDAATRWRAQLAAVAALPHVVCKLSGLVTETDWHHRPSVSPSDAQNIWACFDHALAVFGPERLMYGSDWPVCQLAAGYDTVHGLAATWAQQSLSVHEQAAFWSGNAQRYYGLDLAHCGSPTLPSAAS